MPSRPAILCAVDLSAHARLVVQHAGAVAEHFGARLLVVTVGSTGASAPRTMDRLVRGTLSTHPASAVEVRMVHSPEPAGRVILRLAAEERVDLIAMGTQGSGGLRRRLFGSTTEEVLQQTPVPTLIVPRAAAAVESVRQLRHLGSVLAPTDFSEPSRREVRIAAAVAGAAGIPLLLVHVVSGSSGFGETDRTWKLRMARAQSTLEAMRRELKGAVVEVVARAGRPADEIARVAEERRAGLIVMGLRGLGGPGGPKPGSIAYRVLYLAPTLLLAIPPAAARPRRTSHATQDLLPTPALT